MVGARQQLHAAMLEAVQNHAPEVVVVDEISNRQVRRSGRHGSAGVCSRMVVPLLWLLLIAVLRSSKWS